MGYFILLKVILHDVKINTKEKTQNIMYAWIWDQCLVHENADRNPQKRYLEPSLIYLRKRTRADTY